MPAFAGMANQRTNHMMVDGDNSYSVDERMLMDSAWLHSDKESVQMEKIHCVID
jgi:hypothetical protein